MTERMTIELTGLSARVRTAIAESTEPDPRAITASLLVEMDEAMVEEGLRKGLQLYVQRQAQAMKQEAMRLARIDAERLTAPRRRAQAKQNAAEQLASISASHEQMVADRFFSTWKETPTGRKFLGECTFDDLRYSQARNSERSDDLRRAANADGRLADAVEAAHCETVRDLGYEAAVVALAEVSQKLKAA